MAHWDAVPVAFANIVEMVGLVVLMILIFFARRNALFLVGSLLDIAVGPPHRGAIEEETTATLGARAWKAVVNLATHSGKGDRTTRVHLPAMRRVYPPTDLSALWPRIRHHRRGVPTHP